ncbi:MAG: hypothetical protein WAO74_10615 [Polaribacter sp.]|uniref:hypothetical protein n=1 Tax=Polaribacter sp. TaxID=1920175 RepID=UPI003BB148B5
MKYQAILVLFMAFLISTNSSAQEVANDTIKKSFWKKLYGQPVESAIIFMPIGHHIINPDVIFPFYTGINYKGFEISMYANSHNDITTSIYYKRKQNLSEKWSFIYGIGLAYGYDGKLAEVEGLPFRETLFSGPITPMVGFEFNYKISKKISINLSVAPPVVIAYGIRYALNW